MVYKLSAVLNGHTADVRALASQGSDTLVSVSRDKTGRIWKRTGPNSFTEDSAIVGHSGYVNSVAIIPPTAEHGSGLVATGGVDKAVSIWDPSNLSEALTKLTGHTENVCALTTSADGKTLVSGSWDKTAKVWVDGVCKYTLAGHQHAVWCVLVLEDGSVLTGSADKTICRWVNGALAHTYTGHADCVRALAVVPGVGFASASNDSSVRIWSLDGACVGELYGHSSFVYTLAVLPDGAIVSGGEDRSVRVWRDNEVDQTIMLPATSVWAVAVLENGDIACGTSDGAVRVFSSDHTRLASAETTKAFDAANASFAVNMKTMGGLDTSKLPGPERLNQPGAKDQQVIMVKDGPTVMAYQWDQGTQQWAKVGEVVDAVGQSQKQVYEGKEYDYVFDVDIQEGAPPLKLPYNVTENPYSAAQKFLERNEINMEYIDTVANFIIKNTDGVKLGADQAAHADPFTGSNRYIPGQSASNTEPAHADPFTGSSRYVPAGSSAAGPSAESSYVPPSDFVINKQGNVAAIVGKLAEFNAAVAQESEGGNATLDDAQIQAIRGVDASLASAGSVSTDAYTAILKSVLLWPSAKRFPGLDLLRLIVASSSLPITYQADGKGFIDHVGESTGFFKLLDDSNTQAITKGDEINLMMGARSLANAFASNAGLDLVWASRRQILSALDNSWAKTTNKNLATALSNLYLNMAIAATRKGDEDDGLNILTSASRFLTSTDNADAQLRLVSVFGVLAAAFQLCKDSARVLGDESIVILGIQGKSDTLRRAARDIGSFLSA
ncbi:PFU-domain-containing protein [Martensiomyces pterosporus]|nr:PFU-domain-containing protein [Martensiomyces pterosporus]